MNLLFLNVGRRCELVDAFRRALNTRGGGMIYGSDIDPYAPGASKVDRFHLLPHASADGFAEELSRLCREESIDLIIPSIDPDLVHLSRIRDQLAKETSQTQLLLCPTETIEWCNDKRLTKAKFAEAGALVPEDIDPDRTGLKFPVFMKPATGSAGEGIHCLHSQEELHLFRNACEDPMFEAYIGGPEITVDVLCDLVGTALIAVPRKRLKVRGGEVSRGIVERNSALEQLAMKLAEAFECTGPVTIQFRQPEPGVFVAMEVNARVGGGLPLTIAAGGDWPGWILDLLTGETPNVDVPIEDGLMMSRYDRSCFISTKQGEGARPTDGWHRFRAVIFDLDDTLYPERDYVYSGFHAAAHKVYEDYGVEAETFLRREFDGGRRTDIFGHTLRQLGMEPEEDYIKKLVETYRMCTEPLRPFVDVLPVLAELRSKTVKIGLITDGWAAVQKNKVQRLGLESQFDAIVYSDELGGRDCWKPSPQPFESCLQKLGIEPEHTVYVGDNPDKDFITARRLGMRTIRVRRPSGEHTFSEPPTEDHAADWEISSLQDLMKIVEHR